MHAGTAAVAAKLLELEAREAALLDARETRAVSPPPLSPPPPYRTNWTHLVLSPVLTGHVSSSLQAREAADAGAELNDAILRGRCASGPCSAAICTCSLCSCLLAILVFLYFIGVICASPARRECEALLRDAGTRLDAAASGALAAAEELGARQGALAPRVGAAEAACGATAAELATMLKLRNEVQARMDLHQVVGPPSQPGNRTPSCRWSRGGPVPAPRPVPGPRRTAAGRDARR